MDSESNTIPMYCVIQSGGSSGMESQMEHTVFNFYPIRMGI
jgi:hypothetical protein